MKTHTLWIFLVTLAACAGPHEIDAPASPTPIRGIIAAVDEVKSIQLYGAEESDVPILHMHGGTPLVLEFDLMSWQARPLSVYFYHADRTWRRDLVPIEYMEAFFRDDLLDYEVSRSTQVNFTHFRYRFPNQSIDFRLSGNYVLRVTEQGNEEEVLFERPFFVAEDAAQVVLGLELLLAGPQSLPTIQPQLLLTPHLDVVDNIFDLTVCFVEGGRLLTPRCSQNPNLGGEPELLYYLEPEESFGARIGDYFMNLEDLLPRGVVERVDRSTSPFTVLLHPDYARFPDSGGPLLNGQSVISGRDAFADTQGEYVEVTFRFVPPEEQPLPGGLYVTGSFNGWRVDLGSAMNWVADEAHYETTLLIKQGAYEYRYTSPDAGVQRILQWRMARSDQWYTGLVYYRDHSIPTDRLLAMARVLSR